MSALEDGWIFELSRMPKENLIKLILGLEKHNEDLEETLFYARMTANIIISDQREVILELSNQIEQYRNVNQK